MALGDELLGLLSTAAGKVIAQFTQEDKDDLASYAKAIAELLIQRQSTQDPAALADIDRRVGNYKNAIALMADKYLLAANDEASKALMAGLKVLAEKAIALTVAALAA